tara:strand:+ start:432 stop:1943 length:1512 start_codon:yes stop_codon:yes gene_type:complete
MKKIIYTTLVLGCILNSYGQDISDALRYSTENTLGTARFKSMSGAFGALGGDISAININPAGAAIFNTSQGSLSVSNTSTSNNSLYGSNTQKIKNNFFNMNQIGAAFVFKNKDLDSNWNKFVVSVCYEQLQNYDSRLFASGVTSNSISSYFTDYANGLRLDDISSLSGESISDAYNAIGYYSGYDHQQAFLGYESFIIEPEENLSENTAYYSNITSGDFRQEYSYASTGYNGKLTFNLGFQFDKNIYFGMNLNSHFINYERSTYLFEENTNEDSTVNQVDFENSLLTTGDGFSLQLGSIIKLNNFVRIGLAYDSPTWLTLREETTQYVSTINDAENTQTVVNPAVINVFPTYKLRTPAKITGSAGFIIGKKGLISVDYSRKDYSKTRFGSREGSGFYQENTFIGNTLKATNTLRIGGEVRHENMSYRGGYRLQQSPYINTAAYGDLTGFSFGLGFNFGDSRLDLAYENSKRDMDQRLFNAGNLGNARVNTSNSNLSLTLSMNL